MAQGVLRPFTPIGIQAFRLIGSAFASLLGASPADPLAGPPHLVEAAGRLFIDITSLVRSPLGRIVISAAFGQMEARSGSVLPVLYDDPRLAPRPVRWSGPAATAIRFLAATRLPVRVAAALIDPAAARDTLLALRNELSADSLPPSLSASERIDLVEALLLTWPRRIFPPAIAVLLTGVGSFVLAARLLGDLATPEERDAIRRGLPHNPTTEMDLALWRVAEQVRADSPSVSALREQSPANLAEHYRSGTLPPVLQRHLIAFLADYGHRAAAEIDLGLPRWSEDPAPVLVVLQNYLDAHGRLLAPDAQFRAAADLAERTVALLVDRATRRGRLRGAAVRFLLRRGRELGGLREMPKFLLVLLLDRARAQLSAVGEDLARLGHLDRAEDVFFLTIPELRAAVRDGGPDYRRLVGERRARYEDELRRRHVPRILLSDGTAPAREVSPRCRPATGWSALRRRPGKSADPPASSTTPARRGCSPETSSSHPRPTRAGRPSS